MTDEKLIELAQEAAAEWRDPDFWQECPTCGGMGILDGQGDTCPDCDGQGEIEI